MTPGFWNAPCLEFIKNNIVMHGICYILKIHFQRNMMIITHLFLFVFRFRVSIINIKGCPKEEDI